MGVVAPLAELLFRRARAQPDGRCLLDGDDRPLDNASVADAVRRFAGVLESAGVERGDVIAVSLANSSEFVVALFAAWHRGVALTPLNPELTHDEVRYQLGDSSAVLVIDHGPVRSIAEELGIGWIDAATVVAGPGIAEPAAAGPVVPVGDPVAELSDFALVIYMAGSTGQPNGVLLDHSNLEMMSATMASALELSSDDTSLLLLPLFHVNGLVISVLAALRAGADVVIAPRFAPESFWELIARHRPTYFSAVPTIYTLLDARTSGEVDASSIRFGVCGAAPLPVDLMTRFQDRFGFELIEGYGLTECTVAATLNPLHGERRPGSVGPALPGVEVAIVDALGDFQASGERGEVVVRGANVFRGYLGRPAETAQVIRDGWLHTGEVGHIDADGYVVLVDRIKKVIRRGGIEVHPREIEDALAQHPDVLEAAVVGRNDPVLGEVPVAYVSAKPGLVVTSTEMAEHCAATLARYKRPAEIHVYAQLPRNSVGKLVKGMLVDTTATAGATTA